MIVDVLGLEAAPTGLLMIALDGAISVWT